MRVFIFEHIVGGGELHGSLPPSLAASASAMWGAAIADFQRAGCDVVTTRDARAEPVTVATETFTLSPGEDVRAAFDRAAARADAALVIAPETGGALLDWTRRLEQANVASLGSSAAAIELCGDKLALHAHLTEHNVPTPATTRDAQELQKLQELEGREGPIIAKPRFGAGCEDTNVLRDPAEAATLPGAREYVFEPRHAGRAVSVSLIVTDDRVRPLPAGEQFVHGDTRLHYEGGRVPLSETLAERATALAVRAAQTVAGLRGFVGVDLVLGEKDDASDDVVIEINPRLTLSYVPLSWACEPTVAAALLDATLEPRWAAGGVRALRFDAAGRVAAEM